jgi:hypothetical protein
MDSVLRTVEIAKHDYPGTFAITHQLADMNTGTPLTVGHKRSINFRLKGLYDKVKDDLYYKVLFNSYIRNLFGVAPKQMNTGLYYTVKEILDFKIENSTDMMNAQATPISILETENKPVAFYNYGNKIYIRLEDVDIFGTTPIELLNSKLIYEWKSSKLPTAAAATLALDKGTKFWKYLAMQYGYKNHMLFYQAFRRNKGIDLTDTKIYYPNLKQTKSGTGMYFGKSKHWFSSFTGTDYALYIDINKLRYFISSYKDKTDVIKQYKEVCTLLFNNEPYWKCLEKYYVSPEATLFLDILLDEKRSTVNTLLKKIDKTEEISKPLSLKIAVQKFVNSTILEKTNIVNYETLTKESFIEACKVIEYLKFLPTSEVMQSVRRQFKEWNICNTET